MANEMELRHLRYFVVLAEELHFSRAAERLGISQPPLSQQIRALEIELKAQLLKRTNRRVELTDAGRAFLKEARSTLGQAERAASAARQAQRGEIGELRIGFAPSAPLIAPFTQTLLAFRKSAPGVQLFLEEQVSYLQVEAVLEQRLHIGFIRSPSVPELPNEVAAVEIFREPLTAFLHAQHPLAKGNRPIPVKLLSNEPFIFYPRGSGTTVYDHVVAICRKAGFVPRIEQEARGNATILGLIAAGLGVSILPDSLRRIAVANVVCRRLLPTGSPTSVWLIYRRDGESVAVDKFVALAGEYRLRSKRSVST